MIFDRLSEITACELAGASRQLAKESGMGFDRKAFFDYCRKGVMGPELDQDEVDGCEVILDTMAGAPLAYTAYALATAWHETAHTMQPVHEYGSKGYFFRRYDPEGQRPDIARALGNTEPGDGVKYAGRGYVQLTGRSNYRKAELKLREPLIDKPDLAMRPDIAARIMRDGMDEGWFTGKAFASYLPSQGAAGLSSYRAARRIINGTDKAGLIAAYAMEFQAALEEGGWK